MANTSFLQASELDFAQIKNNLKTFLRAQTTLQDYDFEGSNINVLLDILAYNTYMNGLYVNMVGSEMFLDTAQLKESIISHAKEIHYTPRSRTSASAVVNFSISPTGSPATITIPKFYRLTTNFNQQTVDFVTTSSTVIRNNGGNYIATNVDIKEGRVVTEFFNASYNGGDTSSLSFELESENIDSSTIEVEIYQTTLSDTPETWTVVDDITNITSTSKVFFIEGFQANKYKIVFGNGVISKALEDGNIIKVTYLDSLGQDGNGITTFTKTNPIETYTDIVVTTVTGSFGGAERETAEDIRFSAPRYFATQERAVTVNDYKTMVTTNFPQIQAVAAYGGDQVTPKQYGRVIIALKPFGSIATVIPDTIKTQILNFLKTKNLVTTPVIVDPDYFYVEIQSTVKYNPDQTTKSAQSLSTGIVAALAALNSSTFNDFGKDFRYSKTLNVIDNFDSAIISNETEARMVKQWSPATGQFVNLQFSYGQELKTEEVLYEHPVGHDAVIESSSFNYISNGTTFLAFLQDDGLGNLYVYTIAADGTRLVLQENVGLVDYTAGSVTITLNIASYTGSYINLYARTQNNDITVSQNQFLILDDEYISVSTQVVSD